MKKILHIQVLPKLSGAQKISLEILRGLPDSEYEKWILFSDELDAGDKAVCEKAFRNAGVKVLYSKKLRRAIGFKDIPALIEIYKLCRREKFDIVHTHSTKPGIIGRIAATLAGIPLVVHTVHGLAFHKFVKFPKWQFYWACEMFASVFCDKIILVNQYYKKYFKKFSNKCTTIYNGVNFSEMQKMDAVPHDTFKILFVGRLDNQKDPMTLLKAAKIVAEKSPEVEFTLVGDGEKYDECAKFINENRLENNIKLAGWQNDVSPFYASHDLFAATSIYESFGLMFLEAGFYGLPVVATDVEGIPEVVQDKVTGLLCAPRNPEGIAGNILKFMCDPRLKEHMGKSSRERATVKFDVGTMIRQYEEIYNQNGGR